MGALWLYWVQSRPMYKLKRPKDYLENSDQRQSGPEVSGELGLLVGEFEPQLENSRSDKKAGEVDY